MKRQPDYEVEQWTPLKALLTALSDDLALPLLQIKSSLEVLEHQNFAKTAVRAQSQKMTLSTEAGLQLIEAYRLALKAENNNILAMEPVAIGVVLQDVAQQIYPYARQYATDLEVDVQGKLKPVLAYKPALSAALQVLSTSIIRAQAAQSSKKRYRLLLGAHRGEDSAIATGVFSDARGLSDKSLRIARSLIGKSRHPLPAVPPGAASGILIADILCSSMWQPLRAAAYRNMQGLATVVPISKQLQFV